MNCPVCTTELRVAERMGVEIDHCPKCRGVWLDRGELDKIVERSASDRRHYDVDDSDDSFRPSHSGSGHYDHRKKKRKGFLGELFDFD